MGFKRKSLVLEFGEDTEFAGLSMRMKRLSIDDLFTIADLRSGLTLDEAGRKKLHDLADKVSAGILSWDYEDENDQPIPATKDVLRSEDASMLMAIAKAWMNAATAVSGPLPQPSTDGGQSLEQSMPMEIVSENPPPSGEPSSSTDSSEGIPATP